jgi:hypothetical protein
MHQLCILTGNLGTREHSSKTHGRVCEIRNPQWVTRGRVGEMKTRPKPAFGEAYEDL